MSNEESGRLSLPMEASYRWGQTAALRAKGGHNWVVNKAFECIRQNYPDQLPEDLNETYVHYGIFFADNPWAGRPESILNAEHPCGERCPSVREDLWGYEYHKDTGPTGEVHVRYQNENDPNHPNLALMCTYEGEFLWGVKDIAEKTFAADNLSHYLHNEKVRWDGTRDMHSVLIAGPRGEGVWKIGAARYGAALYKLACSFWPGSSVKPRRDGLTYVPAVGQISQLEGGGDLRAEVPGTYIGGNPFILTHDGKATWPIWVPETYIDPSQLTENSPHTIEERSSYLSGLGVAYAHGFRAQPYHASDKTGKGHEACDSLYDELCREGMFEHLPLFGPGVRYKYSNRHVQDWACRAQVGLNAIHYPTLRTS